MGKTCLCSDGELLYDEEWSISECKGRILVEGEKKKWSCFSVHRINCERLFK